MKIYNEIVIDMNPESSSYGETLHEDSYDYEGDMMLMAGWEDSGFRKTDANGDVWTSRVFINNFNQVGAQEIKKNGVAVFTEGQNMNRSNAQTHFNTYISEYGASGIDMEGSQRINWAGEGTGVGLAEGVVGGFTYAGGDFDPTSEEFRRSVEETGGFGEIAGLYGQDPMDFDEFYGAPLKKIKQDYGTGTQTLGLKTGTSLGDIYSQTEQRMQSSGLEKSGGVAFKQKEATTGVMADYLTQQKSLSDQLAYSTADFWKTTEDQFYTEYEENLASG